MLEKVKRALRVKSPSLDDEITDLIKSGLKDLGVAGIIDDVLVEDTTDPLLIQAVITYCKMNFGLPEDYDRLKKSYDEQKAQLSTCTGYTNWNLEE